MYKIADETMLNLIKVRSISNKYLLKTNISNPTLVYIKKKIKIRLDDAKAKKNATPSLAKSLTLELDLKYL